MVQLKNPPLPKNKNWMFGMAVLMVALAVLVIVLMGDVIEKPKKDSEIQKQIADINHQLQDKENALHASAKKEASTGNNFDSDTPTTMDTSSFSKQEKHLSEGTQEESEYLKNRLWGFWHIMVPLFIVIAIFLYWVKKKHKEWTR